MIDNRQMTDSDLGRSFLELHQPGSPLLLPNPWDRGSALALQGAGFAALATTSSGFAGTLGRLDGAITLDESIVHAGDLVSVVDVPISCDFENGFAADPGAVAENVGRLLDSGVAGFSIEDYDPAGFLYDSALAVDRVAAAVQAARSCGRTVVVTARAENHLRGVDDLGDTIDRLQRFAAVGADVLYAPGPTSPETIGTIVESVDVPVNVLAMPGAPAVSVLAELGVARVSVGGGFMLAAMGGLADAARELLEEGTTSFWEQAGRGAQARAHFSGRMET